MTAPRICMLVGLPQSVPEDNAPLLDAAFRAQGWQVQQALTDSLALCADQGVIATPVAGGAPTRLADQDLIWILGFGRRQGFLDKMQLLALVNAPFVTPPSALLLLHGKYALAGSGHGIPHPRTWASNVPSTLAQLATAQPGPCVIKPPASSFGADVRLLESAVEVETVAQRIITRYGYALLQERLPDADGEYRVLVAGDQIIGGYRREPHGPGEPANLAQGGHPVAALPEPAVLEMIRSRVLPWLREQRVGYAGLDLMAGQVLEINIINPGGLGTLRQLGKPELAHKAVQAVLAGVSQR